MIPPGQTRGYAVTMRMSRICPTRPGSGAKSAGGAWEQAATPHTSVTDRRRSSALGGVGGDRMQSSGDRAAHKMGNGFALSNLLADWQPTYRCNWPRDRAGETEWRRQGMP